MTKLKKKIEKKKLFWALIAQLLAKMDFPGKRGSLSF